MRPLAIRAGGALPAERGTLSPHKRATLLLPQVCAAGNGTCSDIDAINKAIGSKMKAAAVSMQSGKAKVGVGGWEGRGACA